MSALSVRQLELVNKFDDEMLYWLDGVVGVMHTGGVGASLSEMRRGREPNRPVCVTLEPTRSGRLMLGMTVSRPKNGKFVYDTVLGRWDFTAPIRRGGPLNEDKPRHRRAAVWGLQLLRGLLDTGRKLKAGTTTVSAMAMPRVFVPFAFGQERIDQQKLCSNPDAVIDSHTVPGKTLVDVRVAYDNDVTRAINDDSALEDFSPVLGQTAHNPFTHVDGLHNADKTTFVALSQIRAGAAPEVMAIVRQFIGRGLSGGATDADLAAAAQNTQEPLTLSLFSKVQVVPLETLAELPEPYAGTAIPPVDWQVSKNQAKAALK